MSEFGIIEQAMILKVITLILCHTLVIPIDVLQDEFLEIQCRVGTNVQINPPKLLKMLPKLCYKCHVNN